MYQEEIFADQSWERWFSRWNSGVSFSLGIYGWLSHPKSPQATFVHPQYLNHFSEQYTSFQEAGFEKSHSALLIWWGNKGFFPCPLRSTKKGKQWKKTRQSSQRTISVIQWIENTNELFRHTPKQDLTNHMLTRANRTTIFKIYMTKNRGIKKNSH